MKKFLLPALFVTVFCALSFAARNFVENTDYFVDFKQNSENMAAVLHINFISMQPEPSEAESILKSHLKTYGAQLEKERLEQKKAKPKAKTGKDEDEKYKNIIGSVWYAENGDPENMVKVKYKEDLSAYVWLGKTKKIVAFPSYIAFLKQEKESKKEKDKVDAAAAKQAEETVL